MTGLARALTVSLLTVAAGYAQLPTAPNQPASGPGGSAYLYPSTQSFGPYYANPAAPEPYATFYIFEPSGKPVPGSLPVVLFLHAFLLALEGVSGDSPTNYTAWIDHLTRNGYTVVFPTYDSGLQPPQFTSSIVSSWQAALTLLETNHIAGLVPPASDAAGLQTLFTGHSLGAVESFAVAQQLTRQPNPWSTRPEGHRGVPARLGKERRVTYEFWAD